MEIFSKTEGSTFYFQSPLPYLCTCTITVDAKRKDHVEERKSERQMKIETSRKFLDCTIIAYSFLRNGYNYCLANVFRKMEIAYKNGTAFREIPMKEEYGLSMPSLEKLITPTESMDFYKARVVYGEQGVEAVEYAPYFIRNINSLQVVADDTITYGYKSTDRSRLNALVAQKGNRDDIIIVKHGLLTDTSFTNLAIFDGKHWVTPRHPLLPGTKRAALLDKGMIQEADITLEDLRNANKVSLFNAMIEFGEREIAMENVHF